MKNVKPWWQLLPLLALLSIASGCVNAHKLIKAETVVQEADAVFNPAALYVVPPEGLWMPDLLVEVGPGTFERTGRIYIFPGATIGYDPEVLPTEPEQ